MINWVIWASMPLLMAAWFVAERHFAGEKMVFSQKDNAIIKLVFINIAIDVFLSLIVLFPILGIFVPFNLWSFSNWDVDPAINFFVCFLLIDFFYYAIHRLYHSIPFLWRFHRLHHSDRHVESPRKS